MWCNRPGLGPNAPVKPRYTGICEDAPTRLYLGGSGGPSVTSGGETAPLGASWPSKRVLLQRLGNVPEHRPVPHGPGLPDAGTLRMNRFVEVHGESGSGLIRPRWMSPFQRGRFPPRAG